MKLKTGIIMIFLIIGLLGIPNCISAQEYQVSSSGAILESNSASIHLNALTPAAKKSGAQKVSAAPKKPLKS